MPCIAFIIGILHDFLKNVYIKEHLLYSCIDKFVKNLNKVPKKGKLVLIYSSFYGTI
jgi:hypothetical protein